MNKQTKDALKAKVIDIDFRLDNLQKQMDRLEDDFISIKNKRDSMQSLIENLRIEKNAIKEDIDEKSIAG